MGYQDFDVEDVDEPELNKRRSNSAIMSLRIPEESKQDDKGRKSMMPAKPKSPVNSRLK